MTDKLDDGGPAFPIEQLVDEKYMDEYGYGRRRPVLKSTGGMTLRDHFAGKAMQAILTALHEGIRPVDLPAMARDSYGIADAMIAERKKRMEPKP